MKIDFHTHTHHSYDCLMNPEKILKLAKQRGLDGIVINDHDTIKGGLEASKLNKDKNFHVIIGAEIATNAGDITGIFLKKEIVAREVNEVIREIKDQGGKVILNHPYKHHDLDKIDMAQIDFVEGYNGRLGKADNEKAVDLAKKHGIPILAGSDSHLYGEIGNCFTVIEDLTTLKPLQFQYRKSHKVYHTLSQYVKAYKKGSYRIFINATISLGKYYLRKLR